MNIAIAVGLITAGSTLAGGIIASITALRVQSKQLAFQNVLAQADQIDKNTTQQRIIRRESYVNLLNRSDELDRLMTKCWTQKPFREANEPIGAAWVALEGGLGALDSAINVVKLEGPQSVIDAANKARKTYWDEQMHVSRLAINNIGSTEILHQIESKMYGDFLQKRLAAKANLVEAAARALADEAVSSAVNDDLTADRQSR